MIELPQVTLIAYGSEKYRESQQKAIDYSCKDIKFGAVKNVIKECDGIDEWNKNIIYDLTNHVDTDFCLLIHPDGYIIHPECWRDEWLQYDYIGSPWPLPTDDFSYRDKSGTIQRVGNSVSLRSKRLIDLAPKFNLPWQSFHGFTNEDGFICVNNRHIYEEHGMKFAPLDVAIRFGKEHIIPENIDVNKTFVFHTP